MSGVFNYDQLHHNITQEDLELLKQECRMVADYLVDRLQFAKWPVYYKHLILCYSPFVYEIRYFQIQFAVLNHIPLSTLLWIFKLNYNCPDTFSKSWIKVFKDLYNYVLKQKEENPSNVKSYVIVNDGVQDGNYQDVFHYNVSGSLPWARRPHYKIKFPFPCDRNKVHDYLETVGVYDIIGNLVDKVQL